MSSDFVLGFSVCLFFLLFVYQVFLKKRSTPEEMREEEQKAMELKMEKIKEVKERNVKKCKEDVAQAEAKAEAAKERKLKRFKENLANAEQELLSVDQVDPANYWENGQLMPWIILVTAPQAWERARRD